MAKSINEEIKREYILLADQANKRMARLEAKGLTESPAYGSAQIDLKKATGKYDQGSLRFPKGVQSMNMKQIKSYMKQAKHYLGMQTSSITGIKAVVKKREVALGPLVEGATEREKMGIYKILNSDDFKKLSELYDSHQIIAMLQEAKDRGASNRQVSNILRKALQTENDSSLKEFVEEYLDRRGL